MTANQLPPGFRFEGEALSHIDGRRWVGSRQILLLIARLVACQDGTIPPETFTFYSDKKGVYQKVVGPKPAASVEPV